MFWKFFYLHFFRLWNRSASLLTVPTYNKKNSNICKAYCKENTDKAYEWKRIVFISPQFDAINYSNTYWNVFFLYERKFIYTLFINSFLRKLARSTNLPNFQLGKSLIFFAFSWKEIDFIFFVYSNT